MDERNENIQPAFTASKAEKYTALFMYIAAYIYTLTTGSRWELWLTVFVALFVLMVEYLDRGVQRSKESWVWLGCAVLVTACAVLAGSGESFTASPRCTSSPCGGRSPAAGSS